MKLRNKKTGEIIEFETSIYADTEDRTYEYNSISELNAEWEDYEEKGWYITENGEVRENRSIGIVEEESEYREIGNYFETKEEAEKAVEKLKAWKRLKDKGYYFSGWKVDKLHFEIELRVKEYDFITDEVKHDIDLLFGGEE